MNVGLQWAAALIGEWLAAGLEHVVICPGSRSTPLALIAANVPNLHVHSVIDERSGAFVALGIAVSTGKPAGLIVTSGTAGANAYPAVIEAHEVGARLWVATADRPWELLGFGAPQTIDQHALFGRFAARVELPVPEAGDRNEAHVRSLIARACAETDGPVHFNVPLREPLVPEPGEALPVVRGSAARLTRGRAPSDATVAELNRLLASARRPLVVCGPRSTHDDFASRLHAWAASHRVPVIAEACSNARFAFPRAIAHADSLLREKHFAASMRPDLVLRFGGGLTSKVLTQWLDAAQSPSVVVHERGALIDPSHRAVQVIEADAASVCALLGPVTPESGWADGWARADAVARQALEQIEGEPMIARVVASMVPDGGNLFVASSMPIRDLDAFASSGRAIRVFANRGVNGIDGTVSSAVGVALGTGRPTVLLVGDVAALHDLHGFITARRTRPRLAVVVVNNDGGGIFHFLPVQKQSGFERLWATPHGLGFGEAASLAGWPHAPVNDAAGLRGALKRGFETGALIELRTERNRNVEVHAELHARVSAALEAGS